MDTLQLGEWKLNVPILKKPSREVPDVSVKGPPYFPCDWLLDIPLSPAMSHAHSIKGGTEGLTWE